MKQSLLFFLFSLCICTLGMAQVDGSFYTLPMGKKTALFKYDEKNKTLFLQDQNVKAQHVKTSLGIDTVTTINPVTKVEDTKIVSYNDAEYHIETEMSYFDFLLMLKSRFELKNPQKTIRIYSYNIYYESPAESGYIKVKYPETAEGVISKLNCLSKGGGFILLSLKASDLDGITVDAGGSFLALIHIKN